MSSYSYFIIQMELREQYAREQGYNYLVLEDREIGDLITYFNDRGVRPLSGYSVAAARECIRNGGVYYKGYRIQLWTGGGDNNTPLPDSKNSLVVRTGKRALEI